MRTIIFAVFALILLSSCQKPEPIKQSEAPRNSQNTYAPVAEEVRPAAPEETALQKNCKTSAWMFYQIAEWRDEGQRIAVTKNIMADLTKTEPVDDQMRWLAQVDNVYFGKLSGFKPNQIEGIIYNLCIAAGRPDEQPVAPQRQTKSADVRRPAWCDKARSKAERLICDDIELSKLDGELHAVYQRARQVAPDNAGFDREARTAWRWREQNCQDKECLLGWYAQRRAVYNDLIEKHAQ